MYYITAGVLGYLYFGERFIGFIVGCCAMWAVLEVLKIINTRT